MTHSLFQPNSALQNHASLIETAKSAPGPPIRLLVKACELYYYICFAAEWSPAEYAWVLRVLRFASSSLDEGARFSRPTHHVASFPFLFFENKV